MLCEELCNDNTIWYIKIRECIDYEYRYSFKISFSYDMSI